jgi:hypothetical protein
MGKKTEKPFDKIVLTQGKLKMFVEFGEAALRGQTVQEFAADVLECFGYLMTFRNIINGMVRFDEAPEQAVLPYLE